MNFDVMVIGGGPAGYSCAIRCARKGKKVALVEKDALGGVCLNVGCIPTKALIHHSDIVRTIRQHSQDYGLSFDSLKVDFLPAYEASRACSSRLVRGLSSLMRKYGVTVLSGTAEVLARGSVRITDGSGHVSAYLASDIVIATGAQPIEPPDWMAVSDRVFSYRTAILRKTLPKSAVIIGSGAIGLEFATIWNGYGVPLHIVEMQSHIAPLEDPEVSECLDRSLRKKGIDILTSSTVTHIAENAGKVCVTVRKSGEMTDIELCADVVLVAIGFKPNSCGLGLERIGVRCTKNGAIEVDDAMRTSVPGIWAIGDVTGRLMLAHTGYAQAALCAAAIAGEPIAPLDYRMIPHVVYSSPQIASFGWKEADAVAAGYQVRTGLFPFSANGKALGIGETEGWVKMVCEETTGELLGAQLIGPDVSELLPELTLANSMEATYEELAHNIHAHPTLSEAVMEAAAVLAGTSVHY